MDLERFSSGLANLIGKPSSLRPFVCEGSPLKCRIFIVGHNPATPSDRDLWSDWGPHGFDKAKWMRAYLEERANRPLKPGKTFRPKVSPSRRVIDQVIAAAGVPILETNIFAGPSPDMQSLRKRDIAPFLYLVETLKPAFLVTHGKAAEEAVIQLSFAGEVISVPHFSRGWSGEKAAELGRRLREKI